MSEPNKIDPRHLIAVGRVQSALDHLQASQDSLDRAMGALSPVCFGSPTQDRIAKLRDRVHAEWYKTRALLDDRRIKLDREPTGTELQGLRNVGALLLALLVVGLQACGGPGSTGAADFVGTWLASSGTISIACSNGQTSSAPVTDTITIAPAIAGAGVVETDATCVTSYELAGDVATASPGQTCTDPSTPGVVMEVDAETFTTADGVTASSSASGKVDGLTDASGAPLACTWTGTATYQRVSR